MTTTGYTEQDEAQDFASGTEMLRAGRLTEAVDAFDRVLTAVPEYAPAHFYRGVALFNAGRVVEAAASYDAAAHCEPSMFEAHNNLGIALHRLGKLEAALGCHDRAIEINPNVADVHNSRGKCLVSMQRPVEAREAFRRCLELDVRHVFALSNEAIFLHRDNRYAESLDHYDRAIDIARERGFDFDDARYNRGLLLLTLGDFERGWVDYETRLPSLPRPAVDETPLLTPPQPSPTGREPGTSPQPCPWKGEGAREDLTGSLVYVRAEQGYGDTLQFVRYLPMLRERGAKVVFECQPGLKALLEASDLCDEVVERGPSNGVLAAPAGARSIFVQSLPYFFGTDMASIPSSVPYLRASEDRRAKWASMPGEEGKLKVGIVWGGNQSDLYNRYRSCVLADFAPLAAGDGVQFFSLQKGPHAVQALEAPPGMNLIHLGDDLGDFADTAAAMEPMDVIVTIDTSIAHLAGALGKRVWTLLLWCADWRWFLDRVDSPWYPSMRLFRQPSAGAWAPVFDQVATELRALAALGRR